MQLGHPLFGPPPLPTPERKAKMNLWNDQKIARLHARPICFSMAVSVAFAFSACRLATSHWARPCGAKTRPARLWNAESSTRTIRHQVQDGLRESLVKNVPSAIRELAGHRMPLAARGGRPEKP